MVIFHKKDTLEKELTPEEIEKFRLREIENSDAWKKHAALHSPQNPARLHVSTEPLFGEKDAVRERMGVPQTERKVSYDTRKEAAVSYGAQHMSGAHASYVSAGSKPELWASCDCGAEFKAEKKGNSFEVKSYGVVGSDSKATSYAVQSSTAITYGAQDSFSFTGYKNQNTTNY